MQEGPQKVEEKVEVAREMGVKEIEAPEEEARVEVGRGTDGEGVSESSESSG